VKASVVKSELKARKGNLYDRPQLDRDIQAVLGLGNFERVAADISAMKDRPVPPGLAEQSGSSWTVRIAIIVEEKPLVRKIEFTGNKKYSKARLRDEMSLKPKDPFDRSKLREDTDKLLAFYKKKGYYRASIEPAVAIDTAALQADLTFAVQEGPKAKIVDVTINGVTVFKPKKVARQMKNRRKKVFDEKQFGDDLKAVEAYYKNRGYLDFKLENSTVAYSPDGTEVSIRLDIHEGASYKHGDTTFSGYEHYTSTELAKALDYRKGKVFNQERFDSSIRAVQEMYAELGRLRTKVTPEKVFNEQTKLMDVHFQIEEGPVVYVDHVDVEGNKATKNHVLKREVVIKPGQHFSVSKVRKSQEKIMNLGFIDDVNLDVQSPQDPDKVDLTFDVLEGKPGALTAGAGFSSLDGLIGTLSLQHMNLFGRAQRASVAWSFGKRVNDYSLSWTTPWLKDKPTSLGVDLFNTRRISAFDNSTSGFTNHRLGGSVRLGPRFQEDKYQLSFGYTFQKITITNVQNQFLDRLTEGTSIHSSISAEAAIDTRDSFIDPTKGQRHSVGMSLAGGPFLGNVNFWKPFITDSAHKTLFNIGDYPFVMTLANRAGYVTPFGDTREVPVFERFFIGGQDSLRGYAVNGQAGTPDGAKVYDVANIEFGFPIAREHRRTIVKFVTFFDAGGGWQNVHSMQLKIGPGEQNVKTDAGFGIRFTTPAFPIRLDWGYGLNHRPGEQRYQINFGIGNLF
jgi:outer membrane protein insertion porin family